MKSYEQAAIVNTFRSRAPKPYMHHSIASVHNPLTRQPVKQQPGLAGTVQRPNAKSKPTKL